MVNEKNVPCEVTKKKVIGILPCSGACNVGMLTTRAVVTMCEKHDNINFVCSLGIPLGIEGIINNARKSEYFIALNGCQIKCSSKALEKINIKPDEEIIVTADLGIKKNKNYREVQELDNLVNKIEEILAKQF